MKFLITFAAALGLLLAARARAADHESAKGAHQPLEAQAEAPKTPPILPDEASMRAKFVQQHIAHHKNGSEERAENSHGKNGAEERAEHSESGEVDGEAARHAASDTDSDAANKSTTQGAAADAAKSADSDDHAAAGQARDIEERGGNPPGSGPGGHGHQPNPNPNPGH